MAGPFDLGTVVVRTALYVDPDTAQIHAVSDPIPTILHGIPLDLRSVALNIDRPDFTLNPTTCDPKQIVGAGHLDPRQRRRRSPSASRSAAATRSASSRSSACS